MQKILLNLLDSEGFLFFLGKKISTIDSAEEGNRINVLTDPQRRIQKSWDIERSITVLIIILFNGQTQFQCKLYVIVIRHCNIIQFCKEGILCYGFYV